MHEIMQNQGGFTPQNLVPPGPNQTLSGAVGGVDESLRQEKGGVGPPQATGATKGVSHTPVKGDETQDKCPHFLLNRYSMYDTEPPNPKPSQMVGALGQK